MRGMQRDGATVRGRVGVLLLVFALALVIVSPAMAQPVDLDSLAIEVEAADSRPFIYTDKGDAFFYGEAAGEPTSAWQGWNVRSRELLESWAWIAEGDTLTGGDIESAVSYPHHTRRIYRDGSAETVALVDTARALVVERSGDAGARFVPLVSGRLDPADVALRMMKGGFAYSPDTSSFWVGVRAADAEPVRADYTDLATLGPRVGPAALEVGAGSPVVLAADTSAEAALARAARVFGEVETRLAARSERMQQLLEQSYIRTGEERFDHAFAWIRLGMDALVMNQQGRGIYAGLPWFDNYWGRDTFISMPGALLVTGDYATAREVLLRFAAVQDTIRTSGTYGRIPNTVLLDHIRYNTADGTPWFVLQSLAYLRHVEDEKAARQLWPVIRRALEGVAGRMEDGLVAHGEQETWMDASAGPGQEWSPRGRYAIEIQALWSAAFARAAELASTRERPDLARTWSTHAVQLREAIEERYLTEDAVIDHINATGSADAQVRPNVFLAMHVLDEMPAGAQESVRRVADEVALPHGVASLAASDSNFHPYHVAPRFYPKDAAYHNGTVWTWVAGPLVSLMVDGGAHEKAYEQVEQWHHLALVRGAVGLMAENADALPHPGADEPVLTGTPFQAWTHAEYLRTVYEDFLGVRFTAPDHLVVEPHLPVAWSSVEARIETQYGPVDIYVEQGERTTHLTLERSADAAGVDVTVRAHGKVAELSGRRGESEVRIGTMVEVDGAVQEPDARYDGQAAAWSGFDWARPERRAWSTMQGPSWPLLDGPEVKRTNASVPVILQVEDPRGDDRGPSGTYTYPTHPHVREGILDVRGLRLQQSEDSLYVQIQMEALSQPGWKPHYGFQLTFGALTFQPDSGAARPLGRNARFDVPGGYEAVIYVGGGVRVEDAEGEVLAEYRPVPDDISDPLGSVTTARISFALPNEVLPDALTDASGRLPEGTTVRFFVGGQDDHGGAGIGDFRAVEPGEAQLWTGGGKPEAGASNIYDSLSGTIRHANETQR